MDAPSFPNASGIYRIICTVTGKIYIGSSIRLRTRYSSHLNALRRNGHINRLLQRAWNKYGEDAFTFEVLEIVLVPDLLTAREQYWFNKLKPFGRRGFNIAHEAGTTQGRKCSPETKEKIRQRSLGRVPSEEAKRKMSEIRKGTKRNAATRAKIGASLMGNTRSRGKKLSAEHRERLLAANIGRKHAPDTYAYRMKTFIVTSPDGTEYVVQGIKAFCKERHLNPSHLVKVAKGKFNQHKGWKARYA